MHEGPLTGKRALVTGASKGIGAAIAAVFAAAGADVGVVARTLDDLAATCDTVRSHGRDCFAVDADLSTVDGVKRAGDAALAHADTWHILVNNAGIGLTMQLLEMTAEAWDASMALNVRAPMLLAKMLVPAMIAAGGGKVINISSIASFTGGRGGGAYGASKAALNQLTRTMAVEWGAHNVQANAICPGITMTEMGRGFWMDPAHDAIRAQRLARIPAHRFGEVGDAAELALFLAGPGSNYLSGVSLPLDGGMLASP